MYFLGRFVEERVRYIGIYLGLPEFAPSPRRRQAGSASPRGPPACVATTCFDAIPASRIFSAIPSAHSVMPNPNLGYQVRPSVSATSCCWGSIGGDNVRMCGFFWRFFVCGMHACDAVGVIGTSLMGPRLIADGLLTQISMPPNCSTVLATADSTESRLRMSPTIGSAWSLVFSSSLPTGKTAPGSLDCDSAVSTIRAMLASPCAARFGGRKADAATGARDELWSCY